MSRPFGVLLFDVSADALEHFHGVANLLGDEPITLTMLTDRRPSANVGRHRIVHIDELPCPLTLAGHQAKYTFSLFKAIAPERWFFDYTSFYKSATLGRLNLAEIEPLVVRYVAAFDYFLGGECDAFYTGMADGFIPSLGMHIAEHYRKRIICTQAYYWWNRGVLLADRVNQTSSRIEARYEYYVRHPALVDRSANDAWFARKAPPLFPAAPETLIRRARVATDRTAPSRPLSIRNLVVRQMRYAVDGWLTRMFIRFKANVEVTRPFVLFPLHLAPEATLLGADPELADQFSLIKNISMNLPWGIDLLVKVHPVQPRSRGIDLSFFNRCQALPNVVLVAKEVDIRQLYCQAECLAVTSISGTVGFEAALAQKPVIVFGHAVYGAARVFMKPTTWAEFWTMIEAIRQKQWAHDAADLHALLQALRECAVAIPAAANPRDIGEYWQLLSAEILRTEHRFARTDTAGYRAARP